jgi:predicted CopG family antitoxin
MSKTVSVPEDLYDWLESEAARRNVGSVDRVLEDLLEQKKQEAERQSDDAIERILKLHEKMAAKYGPVDDSTELIRQDRAR